MMIAPTPINKLGGQDFGAFGHKFEAPPCFFDTFQKQGLFKAYFVKIKVLTKISGWVGKILMTIPIKTRIITMVSNPNYIEVVIL